MLYNEIIAVCSQIHTKHRTILCGHKVGLQGALGYRSRSDWSHTSSRRPRLTAVCRVSYLVFTLPHERYTSASHSGHLSFGISTQVTDARKGWLSDRFCLDGVRNRTIPDPTGMQTRSYGQHTSFYTDILQLGFQSSAIMVWQADGFNTWSKNPVSDCKTTQFSYGT
jgi:hypothetical protein